VAVRAAASISEALLAGRDRVGLVSFGGVLRWLTPGGGQRQLYRIVDALLDTQITLSYAWKGIEVIPPGTVPARSLVVAISPLLDERAVQALLDLRGRGFDLVVIEVSPREFVRAPRTDAERLAFRIWALQREALRRRFERLAVAVAPWSEDSTLEGLIQEVEAFRRHARLAPA